MVARAPGETPSVDQGVFLVHLIRARKALREAKLDAAREELERAQMLRPEDEDVLNLLSILEFKRGNFLEAAQVARTLLNKNPDSAVLHANLGLILFKAGVLEEAESELSRAVEIKPDHARSHLYLGLLYRNRGKLGLALEHLRFAGAKKLVSEIEEALRRGLRAPSAPESVISADSAAVSEHPPFLPATEVEPPEPPARPALRLAETEQAEPSSSVSADVSRGDESSEPPPAPVQEPSPATASTTESEAERWTDEIAAERPAEAHPLFVVRADGALEIASRGIVYVRKGCVVWYSGNVRFTAEQAFRGTRLEAILRADGTGYLFVNDPGRHAFRRDLSGQSLSLEGSRLLALDHGLSFRLEPIHDFRMNRRVDILRIQGQGSVILSVTGPLLAHEVTADFPLIVSAHDLVAWSGNLLPAVLEDRFLEEVMQPDSASAPKIKFEGEGTVLTEPPRPRRRATDRGAGAADRRRT